MKFDHILFKKINDLAGDSTTADWIAIFGARYLIVIMAASLLKYVFIYKNKAERLLNLRVVANAFFATALAAAVNLSISFMVGRLRPFDAGDGENIYGAVIVGSSFPSTHAAMAFAIACAVFLTYRKFGSVLLVLAAMVALSRVYVGIHYPMDVLVGAFLGMLAALTVVKIITPALLKDKYKNTRVKKKKKVL